MPQRYDWGQDVSYLEELSKEYSWPSFGHTAEIHSLRWHLPLRDRVEQTPPQDKEAILGETTKYVTDAMAFIPEDFMQYSHYVRVVKELEWDSSPGFPYMYEYPNNRAFFRVKDGLPDPERVDACWAMVQERLKNRDSDPIRLFIKPEPHTKKKIEEKRFRLISSVSVVDQILDQMIFGFQNQAFLDNHHHTPVRVGWGWMKGGWNSVPKSGMVACDKTGWDWTVSAWLVDLELELRSRLIFGTEKSLWEDLARFRYHELFIKNEFMTSGGLVFRVRQPGLMKSGCVNTIVSNSLMQLLLHVRVSIELGEQIHNIWAMGDDTIQDFMPFLPEYAELLGRYCILKQVSGDSEFAGFRWDGDYIEPLYPEKHAFQILHVKEKDKKVFSLSYNLLYWKSRFLPYIQRLMPVPDIGFTRIWDGE
ncbi:hypothetical protein 2 [Hubei sobemo-like virus 35]|uniref:hypothetical protein 2 n=1 Tax=Hubei sobemo-like virus 35 TaxID=1923222 RepID=UPI00090C16AE|nr:hypothetical protein 2 [Hubei sobemo-like virus 35]APG75777.1 hypothetical protein 2 [Hubei sobemo-like virus 35]